MSIIRRAVEWIDYPFPCVFAADDNGIARFLGQYRVLWIIRFDAFNDEGFAGKISLSDEVYVAFF